MIKHITITAVIIGVISAAAIGLSLVGRQEQHENSGSTIVATTIFPLADLARSVIGDDEAIIQLLPSGASPHSYAITPQQLLALQDASVLFVIGHGLDDWAATAASKAADIEIVVVDETIPLREFGEAESHEQGEGAHHEHEEGSADPHYWLNVPNAQRIATTMATTMQRIDPERANEYEVNLERLLVELESLERELQQAANAALQKNFIAMHDAWAYFAEHYGFVQVASYEPREGQQPSVADIQSLQATVATHGIRTFFTEPQKQSNAAIRFLEDELGLTVTVLDPLGGVTTSTYADLMRANLTALTSRSL